MRDSSFSMVVVVAVLTGCATPPPVKESVISMDQGYADNMRMMQQYRELVVQVNARYEYWFKYVNSRAKLNSALIWATTDPAAQKTSDADQIMLVDEERKLLGANVIKIVNDIRLPGLPERRGSSDMVFKANRNGDITKIIQTLPHLVNVINDDVEKEYRQIAMNDLSGFDDYATNVAALARINSTIKQYLSIDVTIKPDDLNEITQAIRQLR